MKDDTGQEMSCKKEDEEERKREKVKELRVLKGMNCFYACAAHFLGHKQLGYVFIIVGTLLAIFFLF